MSAADYPAGLRTADRVSSIENDDDYIIHQFEFDNLYGAKVWGKQADLYWSVALTKGGTIVRRLTNLPRMPHLDIVANINTILTQIDEAEEGAWEAPGSVALRSTSGIANAVPYYAYGPSYLAYTATSVSNHFNRVRRRIGSKTFANFGVGAFCAGDMSRYAYGSESYNRQGIATDEELYTSGVGTWPVEAGIKGLLELDPFRNDAALHGRTADGGTTAKALASAKNSLDVMLRLFRAAAWTIWTDPSMVFTGAGWAMLGPIAGTKSNAMNYTSNPGDKFVKTFTVSDTMPGVDLLLLAMDDVNSFPGASFSIKIDGVNKTAEYIAAGYPMTTGNQFRKTLKGATFGLMAVPVRGLANGVHTVEITHTGAPGTYLFVDGYLTPAVSPMGIIVSQPSALTAAGYQSYIDLYGAVGAGKATDELYKQIVLDVVARFPADTSISVIDYDALGYDPDTMVSKIDNVHRNDIGEHFVENCLVDLIKDLPPRNGLVLTA